MGSTRRSEGLPRLISGGILDPTERLAMAWLGEGEIGLETGPGVGGFASASCSGAGWLGDGRTPATRITSDASPIRISSRTVLDFG